MDFVEYLRISEGSENSTVDFIVILVQDDMYKVLKSLLTKCFWSWDGIGWSKFLLESAFQCLYVYYVPVLLRGSFISLLRFLITFLS